MKLTYDIPELTPEEKALPVSKYYTGYPLHYPDPLYSQLPGQGAMDPRDALPAEHWMDLLQPADCHKVEYGCRMMPDGSGRIANYSVLPGNITPEMRM